jgi:hypothetical protein
MRNTQQKIAAYQSFRKIAKIEKYLTQHKFHELYEMVRHEGNNNPILLSLLRKEMYKRETAQFVDSLFKLHNKQNLFKL